MQRRVMYIERKVESLNGEARIGWVSFSKSGRTLYYGGKSFRSLKGRGFKANYEDVATGDHYWISGCKKDGTDRLYGDLPVEIDEDARVEYWTCVRERFDRMRDAIANR